MVCPKCGYMMDAFANRCPRCARMEAQAPIPAAGEQPSPTQQRQAPTATAQAGLPKKVSLPQHALPDTDKAIARAMPAIIGVGVLVLAMIVSHIIGSHKTNVVAHILCDDGAKYALTAPGNWGTAKTAHKILTLELFTPRYSSGKHHTAVAMCGGFNASQLSPDNCMEEYLAAYQQDEPNLQRLTNGKMAASAGADMQWAIVTTPSEDGGKPEEDKIFMVPIGNEVYMFTFVSSPDVFSQY